MIVAVEYEARTDAASGHLDEPFWRGLGHHQLLIPRCSGCDSWVWPARPICPSCHSGVPRWTELEPKGTIYTWTRTWYPFVAERAEQLPYTIALVELAAAPEVRVLGLFEDPAVDPTIGGTVVGRFAPPEPETFDLPTLHWIQDGQQ